MRPARASRIPGTRSALDRVDRAEDAADGVSGLGIALQDHQVPVELVEVLVALEQELADDFILLAHSW